MIETRYTSSPSEFKKFDSDQIREEYLIPEVMTAGEIKAVYTLHDRMIIMGVSPTKAELKMPVFEEMTKAEYFLQRREMGIINIGGEGTVRVGGEDFELQNKECLYIGKGVKDIVFKSNSSQNPAEFYINSCPAHKEYPTTKAVLTDANKVELGASENCNERVIYQFIHEDGIQSCQLVMGFTVIKTGSIWNTFPPHTHLRRMESYFYFDLPEDQIVMHFMGQPQETRHIAIANKQAIISPEWSIHAGAGTSSYSFIWAMAGENKAFTDMDAQPLNQLK